METAIKFFTECYPNDDAQELAELLARPQQEGAANGS